MSDRKPGLVAGRERMAGVRYVRMMEYVTSTLNMMNYWYSSGSIMTFKGLEKRKTSIFEDELALGIALLLPGSCAIFLANRYRITDDKSRADPQAWESSSRVLHKLLSKSIRSPRQIS